MPLTTSSTLLRRWVTKGPVRSLSPAPPSWARSASFARSPTRIITVRGPQRCPSRPAPARPGRRFRSRWSASQSRWPATRRQPKADPPTGACRRSKKQRPPYHRPIDACAAMGQVTKEESPRQAGARASKRLDRCCSDQRGMVDCSHSTMPPVPAGSEASAYQRMPAVGS